MTEPSTRRRSPVTIEINQQQPEDTSVEKTETSTTTETETTEVTEQPADSGEDGE
jgi:hypothetical protein